MFRLIFFLLVISVFFPVELSYQYKQGDHFSYKIQTKYESRLITVEDIFDLLEEVDSRSDQEVVRVQEDGLYHLSEKLTVEKKRHNGKDISVPEYLKSIHHCEFLVDPIFGKTKILNDPSFMNDDLMEFVIPLFAKNMNEGDEWDARYNWNLPVGSKSRVIVPGKFQIMKIQGDLVTIKGRFGMKIEKDEKTEYEGIIKLSVSAVFNQAKGRFESGKSEVRFVYESRSGFAKYFYRKSGQKERIGYQLRFYSEFEEI